MQYNAKERGNTNFLLGNRRVRAQPGSSLSLVDNTCDSVKETDLQSRSNETIASANQKMSLTDRVNPNELKKWMSKNAHNSGISYAGNTPIACELRYRSCRESKENQKWVHCRVHARTNCKGFRCQNGMK